MDGEKKCLAEAGRLADCLHQAGHVLYRKPRKMPDPDGGVSKWKQRMVSANCRGVIEYSMKCK